MQASLSQTYSTSTTTQFSVASQISAGGVYYAATPKTQVWPFPVSSGMHHDWLPQKGMCIFQQFIEASFVLLSQVKLSLDGAHIMP